MLECVRTLLRVLHGVPRMGAPQPHHSGCPSEIDFESAIEAYNALPESQRLWLQDEWDRLQKLAQLQNTAFEQATALRHDIVRRGIRGLAIQGESIDVSEFTASAVCDEAAEFLTTSPDVLRQALHEIEHDPDGVVAEPIDDESTLPRTKVK